MIPEEYDFIEAARKLTEQDANISLHVEIEAGAIQDIYVYNRRLDAGRFVRNKAELDALNWTEEKAKQAAELRARLAEMEAAE